VIVFSSSFFLYHDVSSWARSHRVESDLGGCMSTGSGFLLSKQNYLVAAVMSQVIIAPDVRSNRQRFAK
jgi:hypothetical protein